MKRRAVAHLFLCLALLAAPALADKAPACERLGSQKHAEHLYSAHIYAYTDGWRGEGKAECTDESCLQYGHVHCYGRRMKLWDTPAGGESRVAYYPFGYDSRVGPDTQFQLVNVVKYRGKYFANIRVLNEAGYVVNSGFITADYVGCDCETIEGFEEVGEYVHDHGAFTLR